MTILEATNIHKSYKDVQVLRGVDLTISQKEVVSIVGDSGAGKSTLLHILGTLDKADEGTMQILDKQINSYSSDALANFRNQKIGFIFQFHNLLAEFTALENVCIPGYMGKRNRKEVEKRASNMLDVLGLSSRQNHKPSELSGGEQQRVAVARALVNEPSIVYADEPSGNLDSKTAAELHRLFFNLRDEYGYTFVIVTHNVELAQLADRTLKMEDGVINEN